MNNKMDLETAFSINLKRLREEKGLQQGELAKLLGISQNALSEIEGAKRFPQKNVRDKIKKFFKIEETDLTSHPDLLLAYKTFSKQKLK